MGDTVTGVTPNGTKVSGPAAAIEKVAVVDKPKPAPKPAAKKAATKK